MKTKLDHYRIFYETARFSSFSGAAEHLYISQSAISQCIRQLEEDLGVQLFNRSRRGITLTKEGNTLFQKVEIAIKAIEQGETLLARLQHLESGVLSIAAGDTITSHFLIPYLERFHASYPDIRIEMANSYSANMIQMVKDGKADLAFINLPISDDELCIEPCLEIHDIFVCGPGFDMKSSYSWSEMANLPLILLEQNSTSRGFLNKCFEQKNITLSPQIEIAAYDLFIQFASIHLGVACVVEEFSRKWLDDGIIQKMPLEPPLPGRHIGCAYLRQTPLSLPAQAFLKLIRSKKL